VLAIAAFTAASARPWTAAARDVPTARVTRGPLKLDVYAAGDLRAGRVASLIVPPVGGTVRLEQLANSGASVKAGDVVFAFDPSAQEYALEQSQSELLEAEQEIVKMRADAAVRSAQDQVDLLTARFDVRRAEMDTLSRPDLVAAIDAKKRALALEESKRRLEQLLEDVKSRGATSRAGLTVVEEKRNKARLATERARLIIESLTVRSPIDGVVIVKENRDASGGFFFPGMVLPEFRVGDTVSSGRPVVDVYATGQMEIRVKVNEQDRDNLAAGRAAVVKADALPGEAFKATVATTAGLATRGSMWESAAGPSRQFDVSLLLDRPDARLRAGTSVQVVISGTELQDVHSVPRQALFEKAGKPVVYTRAGDGFEPRDVKVTHRSESRVIIEGPAEGTEVALVNPESAAAPAAPIRAPSPAAGGVR
jgi:multidrug efflux pump subunit AcrA (membrane-fusion protein)